MLKRLAAVLLALSMLAGLCACGEEPSPSSVTDNPYDSVLPTPEPENKPDYTAYIDAAANWIFSNAASLYCDTAFGATLIETTGRRGTAEASELLPVMTADTVKLDTAENIAKTVIAAIMLGGDPTAYIEGVDLIAELRRAENPGGWFSLPEAELPAVPGFEVTPEADVTPDAAVTPEADVTPDAEATPEAETTPEASPTPVADDDGVPYTALEDTLWSLIAMHMARESVNEAAVSAWLRAQAHSDGGYAFDSELSEISATALCLLAVGHFTCDDAKEIYNDCMQYLIASVNDEGYFVGSSTEAVPNVRDQALATVAVIAAGENIYRGRWMFNGKSVADKLIDLQNADGSFAEPVPGDASVTATAAFALLCAQADSLIWNNYALADVEPGM